MGHIMLPSGPRAANFTVSCGQSVQNYYKLVVKLFITEKFSICGAGHLEIFSLLFDVTISQFKIYRYTVDVFARPGRN